MIITTTIVYVDEKQSEMLGKTITQTEEFIFDMKHVSAIMPGKKDFLFSGHSTVLWLTEGVPLNLVGSRFQF